MGVASVRPPMAVEQEEEGFSVHQLPPDCTKVNTLTSAYHYLSIRRRGYYFFCCMFLCGYYLRPATIRGRLLFEASYYLRAATI